MGLKSFLVGKKGKEAQNVSQIFPELINVGQDFISRGQDLANNEQVFTPAQIAQLSSLEQEGITGLEGLRGIVGGGQFRPDFKFGQRSSSAFDQARQSFADQSGALADARGRTDAGTAAITPEEYQAALQQFQNPFEEQVVQSSLRDLQTQGSGLANELRSGFGDAGGFGSMRQGVFESDLVGDVSRAAGDVAGGLRSQGFQFASGQASNQLESLRNRLLSGAGMDISRAGQFGQQASGLSNLGSQLFNARQGVQNIQSQQIADQAKVAQTKLAAGQLPRQLEQAGLDRATQIEQIPLQQLQLLQQIAGGLSPAVFGTAATAPTGGMFASGGNTGAGILNAAGMFMGMPTGGGGMGAGGASIVPDMSSQFSGSFQPSVAF